MALNLHPQLTREAWKVLLQVRRLYFVGQDVGLVEEEDDGGAVEPRRMDGGVEQSQTLVHAILGEDIEIWCHTGCRSLHWRGEFFKVMEVMRRSWGDIVLVD